MTTFLAKLLALLFLVVAAAAVFHPILGFQFVRLDVGTQLLENPRIQGLSAENVKHILTSRCSTSYYPVRSLTLAWDYEFWGLNPLGYKLTNGLLHLANVLLVFWLILRLAVVGQASSLSSSNATPRDVAAAAMAAGLFALHPVVVEPVTWVAGREELLMALGTLGCIHFHLSARRLTDHRGPLGWIVAFHLLATLSCAFACLSNAVAAVIPAVILAWDLLTLVKPSLLRILAGSGTLWAIALATVVIKKLGEYIDPPQQIDAVCLQRFMAVANVYWLNLKTLFWPNSLAIQYPEVTPVDFVQAEVILGAAAICLTAAVLWKIRKRPVPLFGLIWFLLALAPSSQLMVHHVHRADRFLYLPMLGLVVVIAMAVRSLLDGVRGRKGTAMVVSTAVVVLAAFGLLAWAQVHTWRDAAGMWEACLRVDPGNHGLRCQFADSLQVRGDLDEARRQYEHVLQRDAEHNTASIKLAWLLVLQDDGTGKNYDRALRLAQEAYERETGYLRALAKIRSGIASNYARRKQFAEAIDGYREAVRVDPANQVALLALARLLTTCEDQTLRDPPEAVRLAERACSLNRAPAAEDLEILAAAQRAVAAAQAGDETH